ncbi:hypothetical protein [Euzebya tangerina]|uniref:hypothetical protein n=1 Tax=Euzebya tangerina TaxID=591198 RepID=UPI0013C326B9|nr:hypothetical protein [Euzebya tangerina]
MTHRATSTATLMLTLALVAALVLVAPTPAAAAPSAMAQDPAAAVEVDAAEQCERARAAASTKRGSADLTQLDGPAARAAAAVVQQAIGAGEIILQTPSDLVAAESVKVYRIDTAGEAFTSVTYPVGGDLSVLSNITVVLDTNNEIVQYAEALVSQSAADTFEVQSYVDGQLVVDEDTGIPFASNDLLHQEVEEPTASTLGAQASQSTAQCLAAVLGVSVAFAGVLAFFCSGACSTAVTPPTAAVCAACIAGFTTIGGASISAVASCFN